MHVVLFDLPYDVFAAVETTFINSESPWQKRRTWPTSGKSSTIKNCPTAPGWHHAETLLEKVVAGSSVSYLTAAGLLTGAQ